MSEEKTFVELLKEGIVNSDDIDSFVEEWHERYIGNKSLHEFLGMTWDEYKKITDNPKMIEIMFPVKELVTAYDKKISKIAMKIAEDRK